MAIHTAYSVRMNSRYAASTRSSARLAVSDLNACSRRPPESSRTTPTPPPFPITVLSAVWPGGKGWRQGDSSPRLQVLARRGRPQEKYDGACGPLPDGRRDPEVRRPACPLPGG